MDVRRRFIKRSDANSCIPTIYNKDLAGLWNAKTIHKKKLNYIYEKISELSLFFTFCLIDCFSLSLIYQVSLWQSYAE